MKRGLFRLLSATLAAGILLLSEGKAIADQNWDGDNPVGNFSYADNWYNNTVGGPSGFGFGNGNLHFSYRNNSSQTSIFYDFAGYANTNDIFWDSTFGAGLTINGNGQGLNFNQRLENDSSYTQTIGSSMNLSAAKNGASQIELNPVNGDLVINGTIYNDNSKPYYVYGNNGKNLTIASALGTNGNNAAVSFNVMQNSNVFFNAAQTFSGGLNINAGTVTGTNNASAFGAGTITLGSTSSSTASAGLYGANGGSTTYANAITVASGSSGTLTIGNSGNTSAVFSGFVSLANNLTLTASGSGSVKLSGGVTGTGNLILNNIGTGNSTFLDTTAVNNAGTITNSGTGSGTSTINSTLGGNVTQLIQNSSTSTLRLGMTGDTTFTGSVAVNAGTLQIVSSTSALNSANLVSVASGATFDINGNNQTIAGLGTGSGTVTNTGAAKTLTLGGTGTYSSGASITGGANMSVTKSASGTQTLSGASSYTGTTLISGGTLNLDSAGSTTARLAGTSGITLSTGGTLMLSNSSGTTSNDRINDSATMTLSGGTFNTGGLSEHGASNNTAGIGALTLSSTSTIDLGSGSSIIAYAASNTKTWSGTLNIYDWTGNPNTGGGTDEVFFGSSTGGLTSAQLAEIQFYSGVGTGAYAAGAIQLATGEIVPIPEPSTWIAAALSLAAVGFTQRKRFGGLLAKSSAK